MVSLQLCQVISNFISKCMYFLNSSTHIPAHTFPHTHSRTHIPAHTFLHTHTRTYTYSHTHTPIHTHIHIHLFTHARTCILALTHALMYTQNMHTHTYTHSTTHTHACTHTHTLIYTYTHSYTYIASTPQNRYITSDSVSNNETVLVFQLVAKLAGQSINYEDCDECATNCPNSTFDQVSVDAN